MRVKSKLKLAATLIIISLVGFFVWKTSSFIKQRDFSVEQDRSQNDEEKEGLIKIQVGNKELWVEIAETAEEKRQGLSNKESLAENTGLLFSYNQPETAVFWMKDMLFAIDIIWAADGKIVGIEESVPVPESGVLDKDLVRYPSPGPVDYVLEVNGGWCKRNKVGVGGKISF